MENKVFYEVKSFGQTIEFDELKTVALKAYREAKKAELWEVTSNGKKLLQQKGHTPS